MAKMAISAIQVNLRFWKWFHRISHAPKPGDRHQNQVSSMVRIQVTNLATLPQLEWPKWPQMAILATQVSLRCLKMAPIDFPYPKT